MTCQHDTGSMYGCRPACDAPATHAVTYRNGTSGPFTAVGVCARHVRTAEARAYPGHLSTTPLDTSQP